MKVLPADNNKNRKQSVKIPILHHIQNTTKMANRVSNYEASDNRNIAETENQISPEVGKYKDTSSPNSAQLQNESDALKPGHSPIIEKESVTFSKKDFKKIDLSWEHLNIQAAVIRKEIVNGRKKAVKETKTILNNVSGAVKNGRFTAIMGPSGMSASI